MLVFHMTKYNVLTIENKNELARDMDNVENVLQELNKRMQKEGLVAKNEIRGNNELILKSKLETTTSKIFCSNNLFDLISS